jgi:diguanylate cyclase (GGDEF)-like protein
MGKILVSEGGGRLWRPEAERLVAQILAGTRRCFGGAVDLVAAALARGRDGCIFADVAGELAATKTLLREHSKALEESRKLFELASATARIGVWECNLDGNALRWTDGVYDLFELPRGSPITREMALRFYEPESRAAMEALRAKAIYESGGFSLDAQIITAKGNRRWMRLTASVERENGIPIRIFGMKQDITEERTLLDQTRFLAESDVLTGLANRSKFRELLARHEQDEGFEGEIGALILIDLDGFKMINDSFGHLAGDECLKQIALRLTELCRGAQLVARIGGDEFAVVLDRGADSETAAELARRILKTVRLPVDWGGQSFRIGASVGVAVPQPGEVCGSRDFFVNADAALYAAKAAGRNSFRAFTPSMKTEGARKAETVRVIDAALTAGELELFFQPKVRLLDNSLAGFEALLRHRLPSGQIVSAGEFELAFDDPELARRIDQWTIETALRQARAWYRAGHDFGHIALNVSSSQLARHLFARDLVERIANHDLIPDMIEVEVTEGVLLDKDFGPVKDTLDSLKSYGIRIALDDFGTGYASLVHLRSCSVDVIKIDRSFVQRFLTSAPDRAILEAALGLGARLGMDVVAEGIETREQLDCLKALGCRLGQGYLFSKALPAEEAVQWCLPVESGRRSRAATGWA